MPKQAQEGLQRSEAALAAARRGAAQAEHCARAHEGAAQKLRAHLADKVSAASLFSASLHARMHTVASQARQSHSQVHLLWQTLLTQGPIP